MASTKKAKLIDMSSAPVAGTLTKRLLLIPESIGVLTVKEAVNMVELVFNAPGYSTMILRTWEFATRAEATTHYDRLPIGREG